MNVIDLDLLGDGACRITHRESGAELISSKAIEYGGTGEGFSSTDLLAAALGSCIATNLEPVALRHGVTLDGLHLEIRKTLLVSPKRLSKLAVRITYGGPLASDILSRFERAAHGCVVHESLSSDVTVEIRLVATGNGSSR